MVDIIKRKTSTFKWYQNPTDTETLIQLIIYEHEEELRDFLNGKRPLFTEKDQFNPLYAAILTKNMKIIKWILDAGYTDFNENHDPRTLYAMTFIAVNTLDDILSLLLKNDDIRKRIKDILFTIVIHSKDLSTIKTVIDFMTCEEINSLKDMRSKNNENLLIHVMSSVYEENIEYVLSYLPNFPYINELDNADNSVLFYSCMYGRIDICRLLIQNGADPKTLIRNNETCLHVICKTGALELLKIFILDNPYITDGYAGTLLYTAAKYGHDNIVDYLIKKDIDS
jgi:ankyrin repeat protein